MKKIISIGMILFFVAVLSSSAYAQVWHGPGDTFVTLDGRFNYTFASNMSFSQTGVADDHIMLNYENISIIPNATGTGNATINSWTTSMRDITVCSNDTNVNMSFVNLTASSDIYIVDDNTWYTYIPDNTNYTYNATSECKQILIYDIYTNVTVSTGVYPSSTIGNTWNSIYSSLTTGVGSAYDTLILVIIIVVLGIAIFYLKSYSNENVSSTI